MTEPQQNAAPESVQQSAPEVAQPAPQNVPQATETVSPSSAPVAPENVSESSSAATDSDTFSERVEVGDIVVDSHNRPVLVLDVNNGEGGAVTGIAFNLDGTTEVVTERPE